MDGQQRLTTLTLLLIHLHHLQENREERVEVQNPVYSERYGRKSFNLDVPDRVEVMQKLMDGEPMELNDRSESVRNIADRYSNVADHLPEEVIGPALPFFMDWLLENVHLVEIEAYSDEDAYTIFETMNDRGLSLSLPEILTRISHQPSAAAADPLAVAGRTPSRRFDVVATTPAASLSPFDPPPRRLDALATNAGEKCGLEASVAFSDNTEVLALILAGSRCQCEKWSHFHAGGKCAETKNLEAHHIKAQEDDGPDTLENCRILCQSCHERTESYGSS